MQLLALCTHNIDDLFFFVTYAFSFLVNTNSHGKFRTFFPLSLVGRDDEYINDESEEKA